MLETHACVLVPQVFMLATHIHPWKHLNATQPRKLESQTLLLASPFRWVSLESHIFMWHEHHSLRARFYSFPPKIHTISKHFKFERLQHAVDQTTIYSAGSKALKSHKWLRKTTQEIVSIYLTNRRNFFASCIVLQNHIWLCKASEPKVQTVCSPTTGLSLSLVYDISPGV